MQCLHHNSPLLHIEELNPPYIFQPDPYLSNNHILKQPPSFQILTPPIQLQLLKIQMQKALSGKGWYVAKPDSEAKYYTLYNEKGGRIHDIPSFVIEGGMKFSNTLEWSMDKFEIGLYLGGGSFGKIYLAREIECKYVVVLKVQTKDRLYGNGMLSSIAKELEIQSHMNHPHIAKMYGFFTDDERVVQILEFLPGGTLLSRMQKEIFQKFSEGRAARYIYQLLQALQFLHQRGIAHRDIKPENILLDFHDNVKLADFGFCTQMGQDGKRRSNLGTTDYMGPEFFEKKPYDCSADIWAVGVLAYELCAGEVPFATRSEFKQKRITGLEYRFPRDFSRELRSFVSGLLKKDPSERMTAREALSHRWIEEKYLSKMSKERKASKKQS